MGKHTIKELLIIYNFYKILIELLMLLKKDILIEILYQVILMLLHLFYHVCVNFSPNEYDKIAALNIDLSKKYQRDRDTNNAPDNVINNLISFEPSYINKLLAGIKNINDKALLAVYALTPPRRIMDYQLMKITHRTDIEKLDKKFNWVIFENELPSLFVFLNHKTKKSQPEPKITIPTDLATILNTYVNSNDITKNDFLFGRETTYFKESYSQPKFTELLQNTFLKYTGKK